MRYCPIGAYEDKTYPIMKTQFGVRLHVCLHSRGVERVRTKAMSNMGFSDFM